MGRTTPASSKKTDRNEIIFFDTLCCSLCVETGRHEKLHSPIFYVNGDKTDIAYENSLDDYNRITKVPAIRLSRDGVGHGDP